MVSLIFCPQSFFGQLRLGFDHADDILFRRIALQTKD
jgi:hypothetical protein